MLTKQDLNAIDSLVTKRVKQELKKELNPINKKIDLLISFFDHEHATLRKRVDRIENHLHLPALSF